jgi:hypothetical protein
MERFRACPGYRREKNVWGEMGSPGRRRLLLGGG